MKIRHNGETKHVPASAAARLEGEWCILSATLDERLEIHQAGINIRDCPAGVMAGVALGEMGKGTSKSRGSVAYYRAIQLLSAKSRRRNALVKDRERRKVSAPVRRGPRSAR